MIYVPIIQACEKTCRQISTIDLCGCYDSSYPNIAGNGVGPCKATNETQGIYMSSRPTTMMLWSLLWYC